MRVLFIDDRKCEVEHLIALSEINREHIVEVHIFVALDDCLRTVHDFDPEVVLIGHGLSVHPFTGSDVIRYLRSEGVQARFVGNSSGGAILFENDDIKLDGSVDRNPGKIAEACGA